MALDSQVPALLTMSHYVGTLATTRCLAERGVPVVMASDRLLAPALWSRHPQKRIGAPPVARGPAAMAEWLCRVGRENPGMVLHPCSDDVAWVIARHAEALKQHYHLYAPSAETLRTLLDKKRLFDACVKLGVPVPKTWFPRSQSDVEAIWNEKHPLVLKPRTQVFFHSGGKGSLLRARATAVDDWNYYSKLKYAPGMAEDFPSIHLPMLQEYEPSATGGTYSLTGFIDANGRTLGVRAATKVLQTSHTGIGMCFAGSEVDAKALGHVTRLCKQLEFFGTFEVEFILSDGVYKLIDFNPRYYGQMGFDIARGAPFPSLLHQAAQGKTDVLESLATAEPPDDAPTMYRDRVALTWWVAVKLASGALSLQQAAELQRRHHPHDKRTIDALWRSNDPVPSLVAAAAVAYGPLRHPFSFLYGLRQDRQLHQLALEGARKAPEPATPVRVHSLDAPKA